MSRFIKIHRMKDNEERITYLNVNRIISFYAREEGGSYIEITFPDTIRKYKAKETVEELNELINPLYLFQNKEYVEISPLEEVGLPPEPF